MKEKITQHDLRKLLSGVERKSHVPADILVNGIAYDSRAVVPGNVFVALKGLETDGHRFVVDAIMRGARALVLEEDVLDDEYCFAHGVEKIFVPDTRSTLARMADAFYGSPSRSMKMIGVTGTNGKTTVTHLVKGILEHAGIPTGMIGTVGYSVGGEVLPATHTTPESLELHALFAEMRERGAQAVVMEVSSHALALKRVHGINFSVGVFTNLTQDHLDFHGTFDAYFAAKKKLFDGLSEDAVAVTNFDDERGEEIVRSTKARIVSYAIDHPATYKAEDVSLSVRNGTEFVLAHNREKRKVVTPLIGRFNLSNTLAAFATSEACGVEKKKIEEALAKAQPPRGRFERIVLPNGAVAIIDYAHTPDALENVLQTIRATEQQVTITCVFGCGGDRDKTKRSIMGRIAAELADHVVITNDNPRSEVPETIAEEIFSGITRRDHVEIILDRREAIAHTLKNAGERSVVLIAGKGHETYQIIGGERSHFDDREEVEGWIKKKIS